MKLSVKGLTLAGAVITGGAMLVLGIVNMIFSGYAGALLQVADSVYPGYTYGGGFGSVIVGTLYGLLDGAIGGALIAWLYNLFAA
jgi:hypothetical protein